MSTPGAGCGPRHRARRRGGAGAGAARGPRPSSHVCSYGDAHAPAMAVDRRRHDGKRLGELGVGSGEAAERQKADSIVGARAGRPARSAGGSRYSSEPPTAPGTHHSRLTPTQRHAQLPVGGQRGLGGALPRRARPPAPAGGDERGRGRPGPSRCRRRWRRRRSGRRARRRRRRPPRWTCPRDVTTGVPWAMASATGRPKPSRRLG